MHPGRLKYYSHEDRYDYNPVYSGPVAPTTELYGEVARESLENYLQELRDIRQFAFKNLSREEVRAIVQKYPAEPKELVVEPQVKKLAKEKVLPRWKRRAQMQVVQNRPLDPEAANVLSLRRRRWIMGYNAEEVQLMLLAAYMHGHSAPRGVEPNIEEIESSRAAAKRIMESWDDFFNPIKKEA